MKKTAVQGLLATFGAFVAAALIHTGIAHADPGSDMCGTGKYFNPYSANPCEPTDRGAYPNYPGSSGGPGVPYPGYGGRY